MITGKKYTGSSLIDLDFESLTERRLSLIDKFVEKNRETGPFAEKWFPKKYKNPYNTRHKEIYLETKSNTERLQNSPLNFFRHRLNAQIESR